MPLKKLPLQRYWSLPNLSGKPSTSFPTGIMDSTNCSTTKPRYSAATSKSKYTFQSRGILKSFNPYCACKENPQVTTIFMSHLCLLVYWFICYIVSHHLHTISNKHHFQDTRIYWCFNTAQRRPYRERVTRHSLFDYKWNTRQN